MSQSPIIVPSQKKEKSKLLQRYETLLLQLELKKEQQQNLKNGLEILFPKINLEIAPLLDQLKDLNAQECIRLDQVINEIVLSKAKYDAFVVKLLAQLENLLFDYQGKYTEPLNALYKKYKSRDYDANTSQSERIAALLKDQYDIEVSVEELKTKGFRQFIAEYNEALATQKKKSRKQKKKEREVEEKQNLENDAKSIYFRLLKKFHPDTQLDEKLKFEYTEITKLITKAYKNNDFMALLKLQIEYLDLEELEAHQLAEQTLDRYNKILQNQLRELQEELRIKTQNTSYFDLVFDAKFQFSEANYQKLVAKLNSQIQAETLRLAYAFEQKKGWFKDWLRGNI